MNDYSEYLNKPGMLAWIELEWQRNKHIHVEQANIVNDVVGWYELKSVVEFGCGTGNTAAMIECKNYIGIDKNFECIDYAKRKNPSLTFVADDVRDPSVGVTKYDQYELCFCFAFLKHFSLDEWGQIFSAVSCMGKYFIFDMPVGKTKDDGTEYHHVWMSMEDIKKHIKDAGMDLIEIVNQYSLEPVFICRKK